MLISAAGSDIDDEVVHVGDFAALRRYADAERLIAESADSITLVTTPNVNRPTLESIAGKIAAGEQVTLAGDPALLPPNSPGDGFRDLLESQAVKVEEVPRELSTPIARLADAVAHGELVAVEAPEREVVVVPATDAATAVRRVEQLVSDSIPRTFGFSADEITILSPLRGGPCGAEALAAVAPGVSTVHAALGQQWPAAVVVFPPDIGAALSRPLVYTAMTRATKHLSIVHACGPALARAVRYSPGRRRSTLLPLLLAGVQEAA